jgi:hypothetical protein
LFVPPNIEFPVPLELYELLSSYPDPEDEDLLELDPDSDQIEHNEYALATPTIKPARPYFVVD